VSSLRGAGAFLFATQSAGAADLPKLNIDPRQISVSGLSSGGYMAVQFEVAYSTLVMGAGVIAAGLYYRPQREPRDCPCRIVFARPMLVYAKVPSPQGPLTLKLVVVCSSPQWSGREAASRTVAAVPVPAEVV
jgi:hypothetical protein